MTFAYEEQCKFEGHSPGNGQDYHDNREKIKEAASTNNEDSAIKVDEAELDAS